MKKIKRALALMLTIVMAFGLSVNAFAENSNSVKIDLSSSNAAPNIGDVFTVTADIKENSGFNALGIQITYNDQVVKLLGFETSFDEDEEEVLDTEISGFTFAYNNSNGKVSMSSSKDKTKTGKLFAVKFEVISEGNANISYSTDSYVSSVSSGKKDLIVDDSVTKNLVVYQTYTVTSKGTNYTITSVENSSTSVTSGGSYSFTITLDEGYKKAENFTVKANSKELTADNGVYTITNITENQEITVDGIIESVPETGYIVSLTQDAMGKVVGETAQVKVVVNSREYNAFNSFYAEMSYDSDCLDLKEITNDDFTVEEKNGTLKIVAYGEDKPLGDVLTLDFEVIATKTEGISVVLTKANVDVSENAITYNAPSADLGDAEVIFTVDEYSVSLPDGFEGASTVAAGGDYTFTALDKNYNYTFEVTMGGQPVLVTDNQNGTFTIANVNGNLVITSDRTAKVFDVKENGAQQNQVTYENNATYGTEYNFTVASVEGHSTTVSVTIGGTEYTGFSAVEGKYTIPGNNITGDIIITVTNVASRYTWKFEGEGAGDATNITTSLSYGESFVFTVDEDEDFEYTITATMGEDTTPVTKNEDGSYIIENVKADLVITIGKTAAFKPVINVAEYVKVDNGTIAQVVTVSAEGLPEGKTLYYKGNPMYWSDSYNSFAYLNLATDLVVVDEENPIAVVEGNPISIDYSGDVNGSDAIDVNDAQLVYDIYNVKYTDFTKVNMFKFLCADMNGDKKIDVNDAVVIVNEITK